MNATLFSLLKQNINHCFYLDGLPIQQSLLEPPLAHSVHSGLDKQRMARNEFDLLDRPVRGDDDSKPDRAGDFRLPGQRRVFGRDLAYQFGGRYVATDPDSLRWRRRWWRRNVGPKFAFCGWGESPGLCYEIVGHSCVSFSFGGGKRYTRIDRKAHV